MQRMRREGVQSAPGGAVEREGEIGNGCDCLIPEVICMCVVSNETQEIGAAINRPANLLKDRAEQRAGT